MEPFIPNKKQALINATTQVAYDESSKIIEPLVEVWPQAGVMLSFLKANFGVVLAYRQEKLNQFTEHLMDNGHIFNDDVLNSKDFHDGLVVFMESYFKLRTDEKLKLAQKIFSDFAQTNAMPVYPLERYDDTLEKISQSGIRLLGLIQNQIPTVKRAYAEAKISQNSKAAGDTPREHWIEIYSSEPLSVYIDEFIAKEAHDKAASGEDPSKDANRIKAELNAKIATVIGELEQLDILKSTYREGGWGTGTYVYNLTDYGRKFISIIEPDYSDLMDT